MGRWDDLDVCSRRTFVASLAAQFLVLGVSIAALTAGGKAPPPALAVVLWLETAVQAVELVWYLGFGVWWLSKTNDEIVPTVLLRYWDWFLTTPTMLITLYFFGTFETYPCASGDDLVADGRWLVVVALVLADWAMLLFGAMHEARHGRSTMHNMLHAWGKCADCVLCCFGCCCLGVRPVRPVLTCGFLGYLGAFATLFVAAALDGWPLDGVALWVAVGSFVVWGLYGVVALWGRGTNDGQYCNVTPSEPESKGDENKEARMHASYNVLDIFSKNAMGTLISVLVLVGTYDDACAAPPPSAPPL